MASSNTQKVKDILNELIQDAEYLKTNLYPSDDFRDARQEWIERACKAINEMKALKVFPEGTFNSFNNPDITGSLSEYDEDAAAAAKTREALDLDIRFFKNLLTRLDRSSQGRIL